MGHHRVFCGIGKPLPIHSRPMKKGCGVAAALLLEGLSLCADRFASSGSAPVKTALASFRRLSRNRQGPKQRAPKNVPVFPDRLRTFANSVWRVFSRKYRFFPNVDLTSGTNAAPAHCDCGWCQPVVHALPGQRRRHPATEPLYPGSSRFGRWVSSSRFPPRSGSGLSGSWRQASA